MKWILTFMLILVINVAAADIISINGGGSNTVAITTNPLIEGFFFGNPANLPPYFDEVWGNRSVQYVAHTRFNLTINCSDPDANPLNYFDNSSDFNINYDTGDYVEVIYINNSGTRTILFSCDDDTINISRVFTITIDVAAPTIELVSPLNDTTQTSNPVTFNYTTYDAQNQTDECELWSNFSGAWQANTTTQIYSPGNLSQSFNVSIPDGVYLWNVRCNDSFSQSNFSSANRTLTVKISEEEGAGGGGGESVTGLAPGEEAALLSFVTIDPAFQNLQRATGLELQWLQEIGLLFAKIPIIGIVLLIIFATLLVTYTSTYQHIYSRTKKNEKKKAQLEKISKAKMREQEEQEQKKAEAIQT